jgi:PAS domain S-box-containing protein
MSQEGEGRAASPEMDLLMWSVVDSSPDMLCLLDVSGEILRVSGAEELILGYPAGNLIGRSWIGFVHPDDVQGVREDFARVAKSEALRFEARLRLARADGTWATVSMRARTIFDSEGAPMAIVSASHDVTGEMDREQKLLKAVSAAEQANRAKSEFLSRMSHELRTPLNSVLGFAQLLEMDDLSPSQEEAVAHILRAGRHLLDLIDEVLDISRIESGNLELQMEPVELRALVNDAVGLTSPLADKAGITVTVGGGLDESACVRADRQRLLQVLLNLLSNAVKYNSEGGRVRITCEALPAGHVGVAVSDTGVGIREDDLPRLFEPFERLGAEQIGIEGAGVGLTIARSLVERMEGVLEVYSRVGEGSTFEVVLKQAQAPSPTRRPSIEDTDPLAPGQPACVLLIEDNLANLTLIENVLSRRGGVKLLAAMHGTLGIDLAREHHPDLVLLDLHLPDQSGAEVLRRLQSDQDTKGIPVVVVSADRSSDQDRAMRELGAVDYLIKPFDVRDLLRTVDAALDGSS